MDNILYLIPTTIEKGIYRLVATDGSYYIGSSNNLKKRYETHFSYLVNNKHWNPRVQAKFNKHPTGWKFELFQEVLVDHEILHTENILLKEHVGREKCMNINSTALKPPGNKGIIRSVEWRRALSEANKNKVHGPCPAWKKEHMSKIMKARCANGYIPPNHLGKKRSLETRQKISAANKGRRGVPHTDEWKRQHSIVMKGFKHTAEAKIKMSLAAQGRPKSKEHKEAIRQANLGRVHSTETKLKMSLSRKGQKRTLEQKERMKIAWQKRKFKMQTCE